MDNQNETNNSIQYSANYTNGENNNEQYLYDTNNQQTNYNMNGFQQNNFIMNSMIDSLSGWMKFMGIYTIIAGAFSCLGIITAAIGVPLIFAGIALIKGSKSIKTYKQYNNQYNLNEVFTSLNKYFKIQGILTIVGIVLSIIVIILSIFSAVFTINSFQNYNYY
jgi:hypothetical protein